MWVIPWSPTKDAWLKRIRMWTAAPKARECQGISAAQRISKYESGWWFGTCFFFSILGIIIPIHIFSFGISQNVPFVSDNHQVTSTSHNFTAGVQDTFPPLTAWRTWAPWFKLKGSYRPEPTDVCQCMVCSSLFLGKPS